MRWYNMIVLLSDVLNTFKETIIAPMRKRMMVAWELKTFLADLKHTPNPLINRTQK